MTAPDRPRATLVQQHLAAAGLLMALPRAELYITTNTSGILNVQVPKDHPAQRDLFRQVAELVHADVIHTKVMHDGTRHLAGDGGDFDGIPVRLYAPLADISAGTDTSEPGVDATDGQVAAR